MDSSRCLFVLCVCFTQPASADDVKPPEGFTALGGWHGRDAGDPAQLETLPQKQRDAQLALWTAEARKHWRIDKGELTHDGQGVGLASDREIGDVEIRLEYRTAPKASGSVQLRGGKVNLAGPAERWHRMTIHLVGERVTVEVNGELPALHARLDNTWDRREPLPPRGHLLLSGAGGEVRWRNLSVRDIPSDEVNARLRKHDVAGFRDVFNGKDFTGWDGPIDNYDVKDGAIVCRPKKGGNIYTKEVFDDFVARVEYRLPPAGNNGLAIRYPGKGQASLVAMCEVQVLDDTSPTYARLDPRQYNGSAYGMIPAKRGFLRPLGEWNFMEVTVKGHEIRVELNGTRIVDGDLSKVTQFMGGKPHPGKDRLSGHFGFCGHNDPVAFRHIQIKPLGKK